MRLRFAFALAGSLLLSSPALAQSLHFEKPTPERWQIFLGQYHLFGGLKHLFLELRQNQTPLAIVHGLGVDLDNNAYKIAFPLADFTKVRVILRPRDGVLFLEQPHKMTHTLLLESSYEDVVSRMAKIAALARTANQKCLPYYSFIYNSNGILRALIDFAGLGERVPEDIKNAAPGYNTPFLFRTLPSLPKAPNIYFQFQALALEAESHWVNPKSLAACAKEKQARPPLDVRLKNLPLAPY